MRKLIVAAATAATLGTLGLTATAQAQTASPNVTTTTLKKTVVAGIPSFFDVKKLGGSSTNKCTWTATGLPGPVTAANASTVNFGCTERVDGVWPTAGTVTTTLKATLKGVVTTFIAKVTVKAKPGETDATGVGSDTITPLTDQLATGYNGTIASTAPHEYTWDAVNPINGQIGDSIPIKTDCANIPRPDGSSAGINQLKTFTKSTSGPFCTNFARSSRARSSSDPPYAAGGVAFAVLAGDAISWSVPTANTNAPASLSDTQLTQIWSCTVPAANGFAANTWGALNASAPHPTQTIQPFLPQSGSGTLATWLSDIGVTTPGPCVSNNGNMLEENEGVNPALNVAGGIFIYSVGDFIAQTQHSDPCVLSTCLGNSSGVVCSHTPDKNAFFCDIHGVMSLGKIDGIAPISGSGSSETINPSFPSKYDRTLYNVVPFNPGTTDHIPGATSPVGGINLEPIFSATGYDCSSAGKAIISAYGFVNLPTCGQTS
jgi:ABC-type phosphate transport system substrate-binding protein